MNDGQVTADHADRGADTTIEVVLPARTDMAATLRVLVASLGADVGFTLDEIDDVRLAVNEVFASAADTDDIQRVSASFSPTAGRLSIMMFALGPEPIVLDDLATTIMRSVVDELTVDAGTISLTKRAAEASD